MMNYVPGELLRAEKLVQPDTQQPIQRKLKTDRGHAEEFANDNIVESERAVVEIVAHHLYLG